MNEPSSQSINAIYTTGFNKLESLLEMKADAQGLWSREEYEEIWQRQLLAPLTQNLRDGSEKLRGLFDLAQAAIKQPPRTFGDLFQQPDPPVSLLQVVKEYGKELLDQADSGHPTTLPPEMAGILYLGSIAAALVRRKQRIGARQDETLLRMLKKALDHDWLDPATRTLLQQAQAELGRVSATGTN